MEKITSIITSSVYTDAATISGVWRSPGGYWKVVDADAYMELQYVPPGGGLGQALWTAEVPAPVGTGNLAAGTIGVRFRDAGEASGPAVVTAVLAAEAEPAIQIGAPGSVATTQAVSQITGIIPATGTTPTAGTGFTYTHTNGTGIYVFTFTTPFAATPTIMLTADSLARPTFVKTAESPTGFTVQEVASVDGPFSFLAVPTV